MPDTPALPEAFGQPTEQRPGYGFPIARLLGLFHAGTGLLMKLAVVPLCTHDLTNIQRVHPTLAPRDVLVADRGWCSYAHLPLLVQAALHAVPRVGARQMVAFTPDRPCVRPGTRRTPTIKGLPRSRWRTALGHHDQLVEWLKPKTWPSWLAHATFAALPAALVVRELRYQASTPGFRTHQITLVTTLLDAAFSRTDDLVALYGTRWEVETHLGQLKTTMHMDVLHCQTVAGVLKELTVWAIIYNLVRLVILPSARLQQVDAARISFLDALRWLGTSSTGMPLAALLVNCARPHHVEPRVKRRRPKRFPFMIQPRQELYQ
jgi:Transposase DDE domain